MGCPTLGQLWTGRPHVMRSIDVSEWQAFFVVKHELEAQAALAARVQAENEARARRVAGR